MSYATAQQHGERQSGRECLAHTNRKTHNGPFSIQLDETTTVIEEALLIVYVQYIKEIELKQDIIMPVNLTTTTTGEYISSEVDTHEQSTSFL